MTERRGRKSAAERSVAPVAHIGGQRPEPAEGLSEQERAVWREVADSMPPDWFGSEHLRILRAYCRHTVRADQIQDAVAQAIEVGMNCDDQIAKVDKLSRMAERESRAALALARSMRITHQAQYDTSKAARARKNRGGNPADLCS